MANAERNQTDTPRRATEGGCGSAGPDLRLRERVVSGNRNTGGPGNKQSHGDETPREKRVGKGADKDVKHSG